MLTVHHDQNTNFEIAVMVTQTSILNATIIEFEGMENLPWMN